MKRTKTIAKELKALCNGNYTTTNTNKTTTTTETVLNYKPGILKMVCVNDWTGFVYKMK